MRTPAKTHRKTQMAFPTAVGPPVPHTMTMGMAPARRGQGTDDGGQDGFRRLVMGAGGYDGEQAMQRVVDGPLTESMDAQVVRHELMEGHPDFAFLQLVAGAANMTVEALFNDASVGPAVRAEVERRRAAYDERRAVWSRRTADSQHRREIELLTERVAALSAAADCAADKARTRRASRACCAPWSTPRRGCAPWPQSNRPPGCGPCTRRGRRGATAAASCSTRPLSRFCPTARTCGTRPRR
jgi:hypothetical protein